MIDEKVIENLELPARELIDKYKQLKNNPQYSDENYLKTLTELERKIPAILEERYRNLIAWEKVVLSRHPERPQALDFINGLTEGNFIELHGDKCYGDDPAIIAGIGKIDKLTVFIIGTQKGKNTKERQYRNFGMPSPEGYRKALRIYKLAERFKKPILTIVDTPGAYPGIGAEERGQAYAIAECIYNLINIQVPVISIIIGEGGSGGALALCTANVILMLENSWLSVISPEACSAILWRDTSKKKEAAQALSLTPENLLKANIIDDIIPEPPPGAHLFPHIVISQTKKIFLKYIKQLKQLTTSQLLQSRYHKYAQIGVFNKLDKSYAC